MARTTPICSPKLFESHIGLFEERSADESRLIIRQGPVSSLTTNGTLAIFGLTPDITIWQFGAW
jgi:hypothetical protein